MALWQKERSIGRVGLKICLAIGVCLLGLTLTPAPKALAGPLSELILFSSQPLNYFQIYTMRPDGRDLDVLVKLKGNCREPNLNSHTNEIIFTALEGKSWHIYKTDINGYTIERLTNSQSLDRHPSWSPDGSKIIFETNRWGQSEIAIMDKDGSHIRRLTKDQTINRFPIWAPNGQKLAFVSWAQGSADIYTMPVDSPGLKTRQTKNYFADVAPCWSPDSQHLLFASSNHVRTFLTISNPDLSSKRILNQTEHASYPAWSPDGKQIIFSHNYKKEHDIRIMDTDGQNCRSFLSNPPAKVYDLVWQKKSIY